MARLEERLKLWQNGVSPQTTLYPAVALRSIAREHEPFGRAIMNVIRHPSLHALEAGSSTPTGAPFVDGIRNEYAKDGRA